MMWEQGLTVCSVNLDGKKHLVAFGGYNGNYSNEVCYFMTDIIFIT